MSTNYSARVHLTVRRGGRTRKHKLIEMRGSAPLEIEVVKGTPIVVSKPTGQLIITLRGNYRLDELTLKVSAP